MAARGDPPGVFVEVSPFLNPAEVKLRQAGNGAYVEFSVPQSILSPLPRTGNIGIGTPAKIITEGSPFNLQNTAPKFVTWDWFFWLH